MTSATSASSEKSTPGQLPPQLQSVLEQAFQFQQKGDMDRAIATLQLALDEARQDQELGYKTRFVLAMMLPQYLLSNRSVSEAVELLGTEVAFASERLKAVKATGTTEQKQYANRVFVELRDYQSRLKLLGQPAPEISVKEWIRGDPTTLADLRGQVVLLEFWATWCKPCEQMFPKLKRLAEEYGQRGLNVIALTRHYLAYRGTPEAQAEELALMRKMADDHALSFRVGASEDEQTQDLYGAAGVPTMAIIDRTGIVRHFYDGDEERLEQVLDDCLGAASQAG
jgi:thiol-disulfide isomerase/thioredoxin